MKYQDLNPTEATFKLCDQEFTIGKFSLIAQTWAYNEFATTEEPNGVNVLAQQIADINNSECLLKCVWFLMRRKHFFGSYENFVSKIEDLGDGKWAKIMELYTAFVQTLGVSQPDLEEIQEELELKKSLAAQA